MKGKLKILLMLVGLTILVVLLYGNNIVQATDGSPNVEVRKQDYDEEKNELVVGVYLQPGTKLKKYDFVMNYNESLVEIIPYGDSVATGGKEDLQLNDYGSLETTYVIYGGGEITIQSETRDNEIELESEEQICLIRFKFKGNQTIHEYDNRLDSLFQILRIEITDDTDINDDNTLVRIKPMAKQVAGITAKNLIFDKNEYKHGETINLIEGTANIIYTNAARENGKTEEVNLLTTTLNINTGPWIADYNNPSVKIEYKGFNSNATNVKVVDYIESIRFEKPSKELYEYNENLDISDSKVYIKMASKNTEEIKTLQELVDAQKAEVLGFDSTVGAKQIITQTITVNFNFPEYNFTDTKTFNLKIRDKIRDISLIEPNKKEYEYKEKNLDLSGGKIIIKYTSGETIERNLRNIPLVNSQNILRMLNESMNINDELEVSGFDSNKYGEEIITLKYNYEEYGDKKTKTFSYKINIIAGIENIDINNNKMTIPYGHTIVKKDLENYKIIITKTDGLTEEMAITPEMITYNKNGKIGEQTAYVNYAGKQIEFYITLENYMESIKLSHENITVDYGNELGEDTLTEEYKIIPVMANGELGKAIKLTKDKLVGKYDTNKEGTNSVKVNYLGKEADFEIIVIDPIVDIKLEDEEKEKIQKEYNYDEELQLNDAMLTLIKLSGAEVKVDLTAEMTENYNSKEIGIQKLNIKYNNKKIEEAFCVEVKDYIVDIVLVKPNKTTYLPIEKLDLTGATVQTLSASGKLGEPVTVTFDMISGYKEDEKGTQTITVTYEGFEKTFDVIFTVQTGSADINEFGILLNIFIISILSSVVILAIQKNRKK